MSAVPTAPVVPLISFRKFWGLGYRRLVPIVPPDASVDPRSSLWRRPGTPPEKDPRGKAPGVRGADGLWHGFDWINWEANEDDLERWQGMGSGIGLKLGDGLAFIDADTLDEHRARIIRDRVLERCGAIPVRVGRYPKAGYLVRVAGGFRYSRIDFGNPDVQGNRERVEILANGRQAVVAGIHPVTREPYYWPKGLPGYDELPVVTPEQLDALLVELASVLPAGSPVVREGATTDIDQESLKGNLDDIRRAVEATPNTTAGFPTRESYRDFGYAIKGALQHAPDAASDLFAAWCDRWIDPPGGIGNDRDAVESDWRRMKPPFRLGAERVFRTAERASGGAWTRASLWWEPPPEPVAELFPMEHSGDETSQNVRLTPTPFSFPDPASIPPRQWLYGRHYIRKFVSCTVAPSGVGKSSLMIVEALAIASGRPLLGEKSHGQFKVWLWNGEDPREELDRRCVGALDGHGLSRASVGDRLFVDSGRTVPVCLAEETRDGARIVRPVSDALIDAIRSNDIDVMIVDPFVSSHRISENDNGAIDLVSKEWARIADVCGCAIELVHHVRKLNGAEITVEDSRGAVALIATARSARALARMSSAEGQRLAPGGSHRRFFRFGDAKNNLAPPVADDTRWFELVSHRLGNGVPDGSNMATDGDSVGVVKLRPASEVAVSTTSDTAALLDLVRAHEWRSDIRAGDAWIGSAIGQIYKLDTSDSADKVRIKAILDGLLKTGQLAQTVRKDRNRVQRTYVVCGHNVQENPGLFD